jgi:uroporphyrinogen decarboxylase
MPQSLSGYERIKKILAHEEPDRIGVWDAYWDDTLINWERQGLPAGTSPTTYFDMDFANIYMDASLRLPEKLVEDTDEYTIREDKHGFVAKQWKGKGGALGYLSHAVNNKDDWQRLRQRLDVDFGNTARIGRQSYFTPFVNYPTWDDLAQQFKNLREQGKYILLHVYGPLEATWRRNGFEQTLMNLALEQGWITEMFTAHIDLLINTLQKAREFGVVPDGMFLVDERGVNTGPLFSDNTYQQLFAPCDRRLADYLHTNDITFFMHTDGDVRPLIPSLIENGLQVLQPMEAKVGLDVRKLKKEYGKDLSFMGNIDATIMDGDPEVLEKEISSKILAARQDGGYIYHSDHSVPPTVTWKRYQWIIERIMHYGTYA